MADKRIESLDQISVGEFIKMTDRDSQGKFNYVGEVISITTGKPVTENRVKYNKGATFEMATFEGVIGFCMEDPTVHELTKTTKPTGWYKFKKDPVLFKGPPEPTEIKINELKSKKELVLDLVRANPKKNEKSLLKLAKVEVGGSEMQLSNYIKLALLPKK
jgi:hypothetical protein